MKTFLYMLCCTSVISVAYWAYKENYRTQASLRRVADLQQKIALERQAISVLKAEWAYLNRPDRLRDLVELNYEKLGLIPLLPNHFAELELLPYPQSRIEVNALSEFGLKSASAHSPDKEFP